MSAPVASKTRSPKKAEHGDQGEVVEVGGSAGGGEHCLELQVGQPEGWRLSGNPWPAYMLGW